MRRTSKEVGVAADAVATTTIDLLQAHKFEAGVTVLAVVVEQTNNADAEFNLELAGNDLFGAEQSVAAADTPEQFIPDQNRDAHDNTAVRLAVDVSSAAAAAGDELHVSVLWDDGR